MSEPDPVEAQILALTSARGSGKSICPSEVARSLADEWRPLMSVVRAEAARLAREGRIDILRKGKRVEPDAMHGVIRLRARSVG